MKGRRLRRRDDDRGSIAIELTAFVPIMVVAVIILIQGFLVVGSIVSAQQAARDGARALMTGDSASAAVSQQLPGWAQVQAVRIGDNAIAGCMGQCVEVELRVPLGFPGWTSEQVTVARSAELPEE